MKKIILIILAMFITLTTVPSFASITEKEEVTITSSGIMVYYVTNGVKYPNRGLVPKTMFHQTMRNGIHYTGTLNLVNVLKTEWESDGDPWYRGYYSGYVYPSGVTPSSKDHLE